MRNMTSVGMMLWVMVLCSGTRSGFADSGALSKVFGKKLYWADKNSFDTQIEKLLTGKSKYF